MFWKLSISTITGIALALSSASSIALGDAIVVPHERVILGSIDSFDNDAVTYRLHCAGGDPRTIGWDEIDGFGFNGDCETLSRMPDFGAFLEASPIPTAPPEGRRVYKIKCSNGEKFYATNIFLKGDIFRAASSSVTITCSDSDLRNLVETISCGYLTFDKIPRSAFIPKGFAKV